MSASPIREITPSAIRTDDAHVLAGQRLVVVRVHADPLRPDREARGCEQRGKHGVVDLLADLRGEERRRRRVRLGVHEQVGEGTVDREPAEAPALLEFLFAFSR